jgi:hypothetical protein
MRLAALSAARLPVSTAMTSALALVAFPKSAIAASATAILPLALAAMVVLLLLRVTSTLLGIIGRGLGGRSAGIFARLGLGLRLGRLRARGALRRLGCLYVRTFPFAHGLGGCFAGFAPGVACGRSFVTPARGCLGALWFRGAAAALHRFLRIVGVGLGAR